MLWETDGIREIRESPVARVEGRSDTGSRSHKLHTGGPLLMVGRTTKWSQRWRQAALWMTQLLYLEAHSWPEIRTGLEKVA